MIKRNAIVRTAGFENPEVASSGVKYPNKKRIDKRIIAVTSIENNSVTNKTKPKAIKLRINTISGVMEVNLIQ
jgi:hypothetical protein